MFDKKENLQQLLIHELKDLYDAEHHILEALPMMAKTAHSPDLKQAFTMHAEETKNQVSRLEQVFQMLGMKAERKSCPGVQGIIKEGQEVMKKGGDPEVVDAGLIGAAQKVEHYEIAGYGTVRTWARQLGHTQVANLLQQTLEEEGNTDHKLTQIAESHINLEATKQAA